MEVVAVSGGDPVPPSESDDVPYIGTAFIVVSAVFLSIAVLFVALRIPSRIYISHNFGWEDS